MTNFIPIFPLGIIVYPGNTLNLHIFEPRYKQLITDCYGENKPFGIPTVLEEQVREFGTLVRITAIKEVYEDGRMDISTEGLTVFRILQTMPEVPDKLYAGAIVNYPPNEEGLLQNSIQPVLKGIRDLHRLLRIDKPLPKPDELMRSYDAAPLAGLELVQEYELLQLLREDQRIEYLKRHLGRVVPVISQMEALKERVKLNGHFRLER